MGGVLSTKVGSEPYYSSLEHRFERLQADSARINARPAFPASSSLAPLTLILYRPDTRLSYPVPLPTVLQAAW